MGGLYRMENYDCNQSAERVLMDASRKKNQNRNRLLFIVITITVGVIFSVFSLIYGKMEIDIQKNMKADGMAVSTYIENGTADMTQQLIQLPCIESIGKEKFAGKLLDDSIKYCDCVITDVTGFEKMIRPAFTNVVGTYPEKENEIMLSTKTLQYLGIKNPEVGMEIELDFYWNDIFNTSGTGMQNFLLSGYFTEYQNQTSGASVAFLSEKSMEKNGLQWEPCRILIDHTKKYSSGSQIEHMLTNNIKLNEGQRIVSMNPVEYRAISEMMGSYGFAVFFSVMVLLSMFLFIYNTLNISLEKDLQRYGLLQVIGVEQKQNIKVMNREMLKIGLTGSIAGVVLGGMFIWGIMPLLLEKMYAENTWKLERMGFFQPKLLILAIVLVIFTLGVAVECLKRKMRKLSPLECMKYTEAVTYHKSRKKPKIKKFRYWGKHPEIYLAKKYLFRNKKTFGITSLSLWLGCELALCSAVIVNGVDLQNYYSKEPDFQIGITEEACNYLIESSPDTKNMKFFPKSLMNDIETTIGNELHSVENIKGFYPIVGKNGKENIKILIDGDKISTVIQTVSIGEQEELKDFIQKNDKLVNWEQFQNNHGTIVLHDHRMSDYIAGEVQDYIGTEMEFYDLVPVGTEMSSLVPEKLVNCGYLDITEDDFPEMKLCWDGKNINILLVTETTYDWLVEKLTPQIFEIQFNVDKNQESVIRERLNQMIRNYNMEFQSKYGHADKLNLFYLDSKSERLLKEQNYIQTSRWLLMSISEILIFIGIMNFANTRISDIMLRQWECKILERVGMTKKQEYRMFVTEGLFYWLLLCGLLMSFGNLGIGIMQWYMKMQISYFAFRYPVKEMIALMVFLLLCSIIFPGIIYKKLKKKRK